MTDSFQLKFNSSVIIPSLSLKIVSIQFQFFSSYITEPKPPVFQDFKKKKNCQFSVQLF